MTKPSKIRGRATPATPPIETTLGKVLTTAEAAAVLRTTSKTILQAIASSQLKATYIGRGWRIREVDLQAFYEGAQTGPEAPADKPRHNFRGLCHAR